MADAIDPATANEECVGPASERAGKASGCEGCPNQQACAEGKGREEDPELELVRQRLKDVKRKVLVLSGKGGVGKSTMSSQIAFALAAQGLRVGLLDVDICGPSIPHMLGLKGQTVHQSASGWSPVYVTQEAFGYGDDDGDADVELGVMSIGFMLPNEDDAVIWRGPRKNGLIKQFLTDVDWGALDYLIVDTPPGTSDEHISLVQYLAKTLGAEDGALVVTTPQEASGEACRTRPCLRATVRCPAALRPPIAGPPHRWPASSDAGQSDGRAQGALLLREDAAAGAGRR